ncbi:hypothetical protein MLD38_009698 [Melastoma candidum]|uniref:Uncharacterized protein n=1 Tax=Melastoma candidum TaxID=119954 RepID=A0ACB9RXI3_9MYRT|nr:hypothetical protein MLD38_009698 [Melastoma candidum]
MASVVVSFSPVEDAEALWGACQGWGTDEKAIISILGHRNAAQRREIRQAYHHLYHEDLLNLLQSELSGDFEKAVYLWILDPADRDAVLVNAALKKPSVDYRAIIEISCIPSAEELLEVRRAYRIRYKRSMEEDVASHTIGDVRKLLVALVSSYRYEGDEVDLQLAESEAGILRDAIKDKALNHEEVIRILTTRSKLQLRATFNSFKDENGTSITKGMHNAKHEGFPSAVRAVVRCINNHKKYYEKVLRNAIEKFGTDEDVITRVIATRAEKDMKEIKDLYYKRNSVTLDQALMKETSGDYKAFVLALLGNQD